MYSLIVTTAPVLMAIPFEAIINHAFIHVFTNSHHHPRPHGPSLRRDNELLYSPLATTTAVPLALPFPIAERGIKRIYAKASKHVPTTHHERKLCM